MLGTISCLVAGSAAWGGGHAKISKQALGAQPTELQHLLNTSTIEFLGTKGSAASFFGGLFAESGDTVAGPCAGGDGKPCSSAGATQKMTFRDFCYAQDQNGDYMKPWPYAIPVCGAGGKPPPGNPVCIPPPKKNPWLYHYFTQAPADDLAMEGKGAVWYLTKASAAFKAGNVTAAMLHLGCFAHGMEDRSSPYHAFGGYDDQKAKFEAEHNLTAVCKSHWPQMQPSQRPRCEILFWGCEEPTLAGFGVPGGYTPQLLGPTPEAAGQAVGTRMEAIANHSRVVASRPNGFVQTHLKDQNWWLGNASQATLDLMAEMGQGSTRLVADVLYTAWHLGTHATATEGGSSTAHQPSQASPTGAAAASLSAAEWEAKVERAAELDRQAPR